MSRVRKSLHKQCSRFITHMEPTWVSKEVERIRGDVAIDRFHCRSDKSKEFPGVVVKSVKLDPRRWGPGAGHPLRHQGRLAVTRGTANDRQGNVCVRDR